MGNHRNLLGRSNAICLSRVQIDAMIALSTEPRPFWNPMKWLILGLALFAPIGLFGASALHLERTIPLPGVDGRIDHFAVDRTGQRLFVAALGNDTVEVIDRKQGKVTHSIKGLSEPQGIFYVAETKRLYVANGSDGTLRIYDGTTFETLTVLKFEDDADNIRYDETARRLYVGHGSGALGVIDVLNNEIIGDIELGAHPEAFQLEQTGSKIFINVPAAHNVTVVDRKRGGVVATMALGLAFTNFPMAVDETRHRLFVGCRVPARLIVFDTESGREVTRVNLHGDCDDLFYDGARHQVYASCGAGFIDVFSQTDADHYSLKEAVKTESGARTCLLDGDHLYLAVPKRDDGDAELRSYLVTGSGSQ
jgi:YVTN family beta-propeller protein